MLISRQSACSPFHRSLHAEVAQHGAEALINSICSRGNKVSKKRQISGGFLCFCAAQKQTISSRLLFAFGRNSFRLCGASQLHNQSPFRPRGLCPVECAATPEHNDASNG